MSLRPDLIVAWADGIQVDQWDKLGVPLYVSRPKKLRDIPDTLQKLGCLVGTEKIAKKVVASYDKRLSQLANTYHQAKPVRVFYQVWSNPLMTVSKRSWISEAITFCRGENIFAGLKGVAPIVPMESILVENPDMIFAADKKDVWKKAWLKWPALRAVNLKLLVTMDPDLIARASPRLLEGVSQLCAAIDNARKKLNDASISH